MDKKLEELVRQRCREARDKKIRGKVDGIIRYLGSNEQFIDSDFRMDLKYNPNPPGCDCNESSYSYKVVYRRNVVFDDRDHYLESYIPGEWEEKLEVLYKKSLKARSKKEEREKATYEAKCEAVEAALRKRFGL